MTRKDFETKAIRAAERTLHLPRGWWGTYSAIYSPGGLVTVRFSGRCWVVRCDGRIVSKHDSRFGAIKKARAV